MQIPSDEIMTLARGARAESRVQGSRFIADAVPASEKGEVDGFLATVRAEFFDATHHSYAFRLGADGAEFRANDDGEPAGTAGRPILAAIDREGLRNVLVVVTRYFGGTKLGMGGLARAYGRVATAALAAAPREVRYLMERFEISFDHAAVGPVMNVITRAGARVSGTRFEEEAHLIVEIRVSRAASLRTQLMERTAGRITIRRA